MEELIGKLDQIKRGFREMAKSLRDTEPGISYTAFTISETCERAVDELRRNMPQEIEREGGGSSWWYVCPECHGEIDSSDRYCRHCGQAVKK